MELPQLCVHKMNIVFMHYKSVTTLTILLLPQ